ncbi:exported hypothetical protein [Desulfamplus magnetovallimortis]|uniref:Fibronectin type-III domain-containing protein n=1 Tax=Desulfamplus magnetovallimortis TaxID=1246637 RepID=A0A1W1HAH0_9BACT|nr:6-bladed beta-propeller [Desulfamplus magnetovallimortis]SLM29368.1 exported hypothetical protein [Desulfamplus magnetovallimortis]
MNETMFYTKTNLGNPLKSLSLLFVITVAFLLIAIQSTTLSYAKQYQSTGVFPVVTQQWFLGLPSSVAVDNDGNVYVLNYSSDNVYKYSPEGQFIKGWGKRGTNNGEFSGPSSIAISPDGFVYVSDTFNNRIQIFSLDGIFVESVGKKGSNPGDFNLPCQIAFDSDGHYFVADKGNNRVQKFSRQNEFIEVFSNTGGKPHHFEGPNGIAIDSNDNLYIADNDNTTIRVFTSGGILINWWIVSSFYDDRYYHFEDIHIDQNDYLYMPYMYGKEFSYWSGILKFSNDGNLLERWGGNIGNQDGRFSFSFPAGMTDDGNYYYYNYGAVTSGKNGELIVADTYNNRLQMFSQDGDFIMSWSSGGTDNDHLHFPFGITIDKSDNVYVVDCGNDRVQVFSPQMEYRFTIEETGSQNGKFSAPHGIAVDSSGNIYVADTYNHRIEVFSSNGTFIRAFGSLGSGRGQMDQPFGIAINSKDEILVADSGNNRIQKFSKKGEFISLFGDSIYSGQKLNYPVDIEIDRNDNIYLLDTFNNRVVKFSSDGEFLFSFGKYGNVNGGDGDGEFNSPQGIAIDSKGNIAVADTGNNRIQIFTSDGTCVESFGELGFNLNQLSSPDNIAFDSNDNLYVAENDNNRIQIFSKPSDETSNTIKKAIIVAGGGGYEGNVLWEATQLCTNYAYRVLTFQGYTRDEIHYLSSDTTLDLDGNGLYDDVDIDATKENLSLAITDWASDADELLVYITDHGGDSSFRMSQTEILSAEDLDSWLDSIQTNKTEQVIVVYDACQSGSFLDKLTPPQGKKRVVIASSSEGQQAYFTSHGSLSFSYIFWGFVMNGMNLFDAFLGTKNSIEYTYQSQNPVIDDNGNGTGNEDNEGELAKNINLGRGIISAGDMPNIGSVSSMQILNGEKSASIVAENIIDADGIVRVWAVITPPDFKTVDPDEPVLSLPSIDLQKDGEVYKGTYGDFSVTGTYEIAVFAMDTCGIISFPQNTSVVQRQGAATDTPPAAPVLSTMMDNTSVTISWSISNSATGYELFYAPYPGAETIGSIDMGNVSTISFDLIKGLGFYVAVRAYNGAGSSELSNISVIIM